MLSPQQASYCPPVATLDTIKLGKPSKKYPVNFGTFIKKGEWGQKFMITILFTIVTLVGIEICVTQFPSLNFSIFNLFFITFTW